ncbi:unnamed protein product [Trichogramma brassicae]|uniref:Uncharacterized protein n=1 Tax=Trichogramma brassicae TaxID=86971 RepID=A0A6H5J3K6_9HYME|nr:unnamed protein product [Trichogramma brassicae]
MSDDDSDDTFDNETDLEKLKRLRETVNWANEDERFEFLRQLFDLIDNWEDELPDLRDVLSKEEIDWLLAESASARTAGWSKGKQLIDFVARTGYKDEPRFDENGRPLLRYTTGLHWASIQMKYEPVPDLFEIYHRRDVNYTDDSGLTHFHVACKTGCLEVVQKFLELGQDPNCLVRETGESPLHHAVASRCEDVVRLLLDNGADPNLANAEGETPLHVCLRNSDDEGLTKLFFGIDDARRRIIQVDAPDKLGRTPLQWAVANLMPDVIDALLDRGADLSSFVFPTEDYFGHNSSQHLSETWENFHLRLASGALEAVERLEKRGYELDLSGATTIMHMFARYVLFDQSPKDEELDECCWYDDEKFANQSKDLMVIPSLSLYDLIRMRQEEAEILVTPGDYFRFACEDHEWLLRGRYRLACAMHLCEKLARRFFRRWALNCFLVLTSQRLPILCCDIVIEQLMNEDLYRICCAATGQKAHPLITMLYDDY